MKQFITFDWNAFFGAAREWKGLMGVELDHFSGASRSALITEFDGVTVVADLVDRDDEVKDGEWEKAREFQAFDENGEQVGLLRLPGFVN